MEISSFWNQWNKKDTEKSGLVEIVEKIIDNYWCLLRLRQSQGKQNISVCHLRVTSAVWLSSILVVFILKFHEFHFRPNWELCNLKFDRSFLISKISRKIEYENAFLLHHHLWMDRPILRIHYVSNCKYQTWFRDWCPHLH